MNITMFRVAINSNTPLLAIVRIQRLWTSAGLCHEIPLQKAPGEARARCEGLPLQQEVHRGLPQQSSAETSICIIIDLVATMQQRVPTTRQQQTPSYLALNFRALKEHDLGHCHLHLESQHLA